MTILVYPRSAAAILNFWKPKVCPWDPRKSHPRAKHMWSVQLRPTSSNHAHQTSPHSDMNNKHRYYFRRSLTDQYRYANRPRSFSELTACFHSLRNQSINRSISGLYLWSRSLKKSHDVRLRSYRKFSLCPYQDKGRLLHGWQTGRLLASNTYRYVKERSQVK